MKTNLFLSNFKSLCLILLFSLLLFSCGGGTAGTDGGVDLRLAGVIETDSGVKLVNGHITLEETGDTAISDQDGRFELITENVATGIILIEGKLNNADFQARTAIINFGEIQKLDQLKLVVSLSNGLVVVEEIKLAPAPSPSTSPKPNETPVISESIINGRIIFADRVPAEGIIFKIKGQKRVQKSNQDGKFRLKFPSGQSSVKLIVQYNLFETIVSLDSLPDYAVEINLNLKLQFDSGNTVVTNSNGELGLDSRFSFKAR